ncbi:SDR family NAD(P)-dependent oxidoreductase [Streptomyces sp. HNM0663]|uniref:SDR family NAD(P)-dependent oxidoreductase n=1 Tax=Streptomyces chengmaiensis TaxID=3040919 RepID=A0ABT6HIT2_9ACTN|nr:SDR family NAD(P)-dependent oxidoreductase [Streptomyces chengmaiensis]MDH2388505.1 SDR family NAD(P)-dependent oxidoreductase [Streptomyces chengmaiensis]
MFHSSALSSPHPEATSVGRTAVITGATSGLGLVFAERLAAAGYHLTLVARGTDALNAIAARLGHGDRRPHIITADLGTEDGVSRLLEALTTAVPDLLINNAGYGLAEAFPYSTPADEQTLLRVNVGCVLRTTHAVLPMMISRGAGAIVNVASVAAYGPVWLASTYPASKSWVLAFTESTARSAQLKGSGVRMMALLPGYTRTAFPQRAGMTGPHMPQWMWLTSEQVVSSALRDLERGRTISIPSLRYRILSQVLRHLPRGVTTRFSLDRSVPREETVAAATAG